MEYKYCPDRNFEDYSSGRVIINRHGFANFPVRLAQEIYGRCLSYLANPKDVCLYDPCCGAGYLLTCLGFLNHDSIKTIVGSDVSREALEIAGQNLGLLTVAGLEARIRHLRELYAQFDKPSHLQAIASATKMLDVLRASGHRIAAETFLADILDKDALLNAGFRAHMVFADVPYGHLASWQGGGDNAVDRLLDNVIPVLAQDSVVAICSDKRQKASSDKYIRLEKHNVGKRRFEILALR